MFNCDPVILHGNDQLTRSRHWNPSIPLCPALQGSFSEASGSRRNQLTHDRGCMAAASSRAVATVYIRAFPVQQHFAKCRPHSHAQVFNATYTVALALQKNLCRNRVLALRSIHTKTPGLYSKTPSKMHRHMCICEGIGFGALRKGPQLRLTTRQHAMQQFAQRWAKPLRCRLHRG